MEPTTIKLRRIFILFNFNYWKQRWRKLLAIPSALIISVILALITKNDIVGYCFFILSLIEIIYGLTTEFIEKPKALTFSDTDIKFNDTFFDSKSRKVSNRFYKMTFVVTDLYDVRFDQNCLEKLFGVGHISFRGTINHAENADFFGITLPESFSIHGIPDFSRFIEEFPHK